jgi:hypothetical protein
MLCVWRAHTAAKAHGSRYVLLLRQCFLCSRFRAFVLISALQVAFAWAVALGGEAGATQLVKLGLSETAVDYLCEVYLWDAALQMATGPLRAKLPDIHYKRAMVRCFLLLPALLPGMIALVVVSLL